MRVWFESEPGSAATIILYLGIDLVFRVSFELEPGAVGQVTDFKESNKRLEWGLKKAMFLLNALMGLHFKFSSLYNNNLLFKKVPITFTF